MGDVGGVAAARVLKGGNNGHSSSFCWHSEPCWWSFDAASGRSCRRFQYSRRPGCFDGALRWGGNAAAMSSSLMWRRRGGGAGECRLGFSGGRELAAGKATRRSGGGCLEAALRQENPRRTQEGRLDGQ